ncbi:MAG: FHA domain-containing protein [Planctomycetota bacterium]
MTLRLRLRHALAETELQFTQELGETPQIFGRGQNADVVVAGRGIAPKHLAIFFDAHSRKWLVQDGNTRGRTRVNGVPLVDSTQPCPLVEDFVVTLGDDDSVASITVLGIDVVDDTPVDTASDVEFKPVSSFTSRRKRKRSPVMLPMAFAGSIGGAFVLGLLGGQQIAENPSTLTVSGGFAEDQLSDIDARRPPPPPSTRPRATTQDEPLLPRLDGAVADIDLTPDPTLQSRGELLEGEADAAGVRGFIAGIAPDDPLRASSAWIDVIAAERVGEPIAMLQSYRAFTRLPETRTGDLRYEVLRRLEDAVDALWWERIASLLEEEFAIIESSLDAELRLRGLEGEPDAEVAADLREHLLYAQRRLALVDAELADTMRYTSGEVPNLINTDQLRRLRAIRDKEAYASWRSTLLSHVQNGRLPWDERPTSRPADDSASSREPSASVILSERSESKDLA